jgi:hypothetical protein
MNATIPMTHVDVPVLYTLVAALAFACIYLFGHRLRVSSHHRKWLSIAAGISVATVFLDILPQITESQMRFLSHRGLVVALFPEQAIYLATMFGFVLFYGFEYMISTSDSGRDKPSTLFFAFRVAAFAGYTGLIAYLLVRSIWKSTLAMLLYAVAMAFHLLIVDHSLARERFGVYERYGRWILSFASLAGWFTAIVAPIPDPWLARVTGFVSGGVIMNSLVVELPEGRGGRFWPFTFAAAIYSLILITIVR